MHNRKAAQIVYVPGVGEQKPAEMRTTRYSHDSGALTGRYPTVLCAKLRTLQHFLLLLSVHWT